jgi:hypothetical protein
MIYLKNRIMPTYECPPSPLCTRFGPRRPWSWLHPNPYTIAHCSDRPQRPRDSTRSGSQGSNPCTITHQTSHDSTGTKAYDQNNNSNTNTRPSTRRKTSERKIFGRCDDSEYRR